MKHEHVMLLEHGDDGSHWFFCEACPAVIQLTPRVVGNELRLSLAVVNPGRGGFRPFELRELAELWHARFRAFADCVRSRSSRRWTRRRMRVHRAA